VGFANGTARASPPGMPPILPLIVLVVALHLLVIATTD
jgi:hypothetical protein